VNDGNEPPGGWAELLIQSVIDYAIYRLDPEGVVVSWNAGAQRFKGYTADEIIGRHFSLFYSEADRAAGIPTRALATAEREGRFEAEGWRIRKDGSRFWANVVVDAIRDPGGKLVGFAKVTRDLTERKRNEDELRRSEERFRMLVQGVTDYAIYMLDPEGQITSWNAGAERFKGYAAEEIIGQHFSRFYTPEEAARGVPATALATAVADGHFEAEGWRVRKDGSRFWANVVIDPIRSNDGELIGFAKITRDLTERREAQVALDQAKEAFFQSQKLEAIGKLTGGVAHDFNNLLCAIIGSLDLAERRNAVGQPIGQFIDNARSAAERGATLVQRMLAFARRQDLKLEPVDVARTVRDMADLLARTIGPQIEIETRFPLMLPPVTADPAQLELAILNLAVNARDAMEEGGRLVIAARQAEPDAEEEKDFICLTVADEGAGMTPDVLARATEPFFTTKGVGRGTGLGLSMVQGMVEQVGGRFVLRSKPGEGASVEMWLPRSEAFKPPPILTSSVSAIESGPPLTILAVDDDPIVLHNTVTLLREFGHTVLHADSASVALQMLRRHAVDLLLTDFAMPKMTGSELIEQAREVQPGLAVILASGFAELPEGDLGHTIRLPKPFNDMELAAAVRAAGLAR
jgi:PAS domain S-box-containing protein